MSNKVKIIFLFIILLAVVSIYFGKNIYISNEKNQNNTNQKSVSIDEKAVLSKGKPVLLEFRTDTWPACIQMESVIAKAQKELSDKSEINVVDVYKNQELSNKYKIKVVPTMIFINSDGTIYLRQEGTMTFEEIKEIVNKMK